jgi:2-oxoglutarate dehydrogenase E1 component
MGESVAEGTISRWLKAVGDSVAEGESLVEVTTDKVDVEVPSPTSGTLEAIVAQEGDTVEVGATLATIALGANGAAAADDSAPARPARASGNGASVMEPSAAEPTAKEEASPAPSSPSAAPVAGAAERPSTAAADVNASPLARRAAAIRGIPLDAVTPTGPGGMVRSGDVKATTPGAATAARSAGPTASAAPPAGSSVVELRGPAAALVDYMEQSREIPTATSFRTIAVTVLDARRRELNLGLATSGKDIKVSFTHLIGFAIARAAAEMPEMCAHFARTEGGKPARVEGDVHLGLAVDSRRKDGTRFLVVPVIKNAGAADFAQFRAEYERLIERARTNALSADELRGATISLTNPGGIGTVASVPRLMPGQGTIVAVGALGYPPEWRDQPEARLRELGVAKVMTMTSTYDHRVIQGAQSGEFLGRVEALLTGADGFYQAVFESLGLGAPAAEIPRAAAEAASPAARAPVAAGGATGAAPSRELLAAMQAATSLVKAHRTHGHLGAHLDPLGTPPIGDPAMEPETYGLTPELMAQIPADLLRVYVPGKTLAEVLPNLRRTYCGSIAYEIEHIASHEQRIWLREHIESGAYRLPFNADAKRRLLQRLTKVEAMERYFRRTFLGQKTFSAEGVDAMVPMLEYLLSAVADDGIGEVVMGMAHRGRLATIAHVVNRPYEALLAAFERGEQRRAVGEITDAPTGDVKYHVGAVGTYVTDTGKGITVRLLSNPSHLEAVDPVVEGWARAEQTKRNSETLHVDPMVAVPVLLHGDAAFAGQGVVAEVLNLQSLPGYATGGTVHIITNNQVGFTTEARDGRSTRYASDLAKGFDVPIVHVNADDIEACINAVRLAYDYRRTYHRDVVIDLIGYRRFGHNETDEPSYTQPLMYQKINHHPTVRELFLRQLVTDGLITEADGADDFETAYSAIAEAHKRVKASLAEPQEDTEESTAAETESPRPPTRVTAATLLSLNEQLCSAPADFHVYAKLAKQLERRRTSLDSGPIDWGTAESLAFASLIVEGHPIRLSGQDTQRGTFSQRHLVFHDDQTGAEWVPMHHLVGAAATFEVYNSPLSEVACLGFEYGYSAADPSTTVLWEAQYGDFVNNAQMIVDQFVSSARAKWGQRSRLVLLLPHGYEGNGPEHSSARLERFLQLAAHGNMRVANVSTAAQYFHLLRDQATVSAARPLVVMTPKRLLRLKESASVLGDLADGEFRPVIDDPVLSATPKLRKQVRTLLLCTGKIYYELELHPDRREAEDLAIVRIELLNPLPIDEILALVRTYPNLEQIYWVQEEPSNMGAWLHLARPIGTRRPYDIRWDYIGRPRRASPSEGYAGSHHIEQERIVSTALSTSQILAGRQADISHIQPAKLEASTDPKQSGDS